jgi:hypothetical protein
VQVYIVHNGKLLILTITQVAAAAKPAAANAIIGSLHFI